MPSMFSGVSLGQLIKAENPDRAAIVREREQRRYYAKLKKKLETVPPKKNRAIAMLTATCATGKHRMCYRKNCPCACHKEKE